MKISAIVAFAQNNVIGGNNQLLWHLPSDLKRFKNITSGHHIVMGRKTYESIGKPLPNRTNIVISRNENWNPEGVIVVKNLQEAIKIADLKNEIELFVIGGGQIYNQYFSFFDNLYVTFIDEKFNGDTFFPEINSKNWKVIHSEVGVLDEKNKLKHTFVTYTRT